MRSVYLSAPYGLVNPCHTQYLQQLQDTEEKEGHTYVMVDGCFLFTREEQWKEDKLAPIFHEPKNVSIQAKRNEIVDTVYVNH